ncbi:MAG TPA: NAD-dependent epimerase/dehydratase family protein [Abditibacterium sp.]|jgi:dTDP-L-rhamnose 4-epimerase
MNRGFIVLRDVPFQRFAAEFQGSARMTKTVLITGGAGFVGSFVADELLRCGYRVRVLDALDAQVHGESAPTYLDPEVDLICGDIRDRDAVRRALRGVDAVFHLAALVGVGQSMYQIERYTSVNNLGTAVLLESLADQPVERLVVASSMSIYGEGLYRAPDGTCVAGGERTLAQLQDRDWELRDQNGVVLEPIPTPETKIPALASVYALSKYDQERLCLIAGRAYGFDAVALRFFNIYGPRQALSNPYTGVLAIFASRFLNNRAPLINEDGWQQRDFVHVRDVARACRLALEVPRAAGEVFNIGSGEPRSVREVAHSLALALDKTHIEAEIVGKYRVGDIRHCFADISRARQILGFEPQVEWEDGLRELAGWLEGQVAIDHVESASAELAARGLTV